MGCFIRTTSQRSLEKSVGIMRFTVDVIPLTGAFSEAWRYSGPFTRRNRFRGTLPGLGTATVAFVAYCTYEYFFLNDNHHGKEGGHGGEHQ